MKGRKLQKKKDELWLPKFPLHSRPRRCFLYSALTTLSMLYAPRNKFGIKLRTTTAKYSFWNTVSLSPCAIIITHPYHKYINDIYIDCPIIIAKQFSFVFCALLSYCQLLLSAICLPYYFSALSAF